MFSAAWILTSVSCDLGKVYIMGLAAVRPLLAMVVNVSNGLTLGLYSSKLILIHATSYCPLWSCEMMAVLVILEYCPVGACENSQEVNWKITAGESYAGKFSSHWNKICGSHIHIVYGPLLPFPSRGWPLPTLKMTFFASFRVFGGHGWMHAVSAGLGRPQETQGIKLHSPLKGVERYPLYSDSCMQRGLGTEPTLIWLCTCPCGNASCGKILVRKSAKVLTNSNRILTSATHAIAETNLPCALLEYQIPYR